MKNRVYYIMVMLLVLAGCIKNDIPYPSVEAEISEFEVQGQISCNIDKANRNVEVVVDDSVNLSKIKVIKFKVTDNAVVTPDITDLLDLTTPKTYKLTIYREYIWTVSARQSITRYIKVENQIGEAEIDLENNTITVKVAGSTDLSNTKILSLKLAPKGEVITPDINTVRDFSQPVKFVSEFNGVSTTWTIKLVKSEVTVATGDANPFAKYVYLNGICQSNSTKPYFQYREATSSAWSNIAESDVTVEDGKFSGVVKDLKPETKYEYRSVQGSNYGDIKSFVTESTPTVPNLSFDDWIKSGKSWFPNLDLTPENYMWDSGNKGANTFESKNPTSPEESFVVKGKAVKMASTSVFTIFTAGNIYLGKYVKTSGFGAELAFGQPFVGRPKSLKGYYNYSPGTINKTQEKYKDLEGKPDCCHIYIVLADWGAPFSVNTNDAKFLDLENDPGIIALGELLDDKATGTQYKEFDIPLKYRSLTRKPTHLLIVAAASRYGDYFTGSTSTVLYIDEFELVY